MQISYLRWVKNRFNVSSFFDEKSLEDLERDVHFGGFQRQFRILGTLARLHIRDKKSFRLRDLIKTLRYLYEDSMQYNELRETAIFLRNKVEPKLLVTLEEIN